MRQKRPTLCVIAGPNGSGKTTTTQQLLSNEWGADSFYINPDDIAQHEFGNWNDPQAVLKAAIRAEELRHECLRDKRDFVFETVLSTDEKVQFLRQAHDEGYFIRLFFVCTSDPQINISRIVKRYLTGGHEVPISKIIDRYFKSLLNMAKTIEFVDRVYVYDNSVENQLPQLLYRTVDGKVKKQYVDELPDWAKQILP